MPSLFDDTSSDSDSADEQASEPKNAKLKKKERSQKKSKQPVLTVNEVRGHFTALTVQPQAQLFSVKLGICRKVDAAEAKSSSVDQGEYSRVA